MLEPLQLMECESGVNKLVAYVAVDGTPHLVAGMIGSCEDTMKKWICGLPEALRPNVRLGLFLTVFRC
jgi:hypothetical protein